MIDTFVNLLRNRCVGEDLDSFVINASERKCGKCIGEVGSFRALEK